MKKKIALLLAALMLAGQGNFALAKENNSRYIYVDAKAAEGGDGSFERPLKTIEEAREKIREIKKTEGYPEGGITVSIRGGDYSVLDGIRFTEEDSGTKEAPIVYRAYGNEQVRILGGAEISFSEFEKVTDTNILSKLDASMSGKLYKLDLVKHGIEPYDEFGINGHAASGLNTAGKNPTNGAAVPSVFWDGKNTSIVRYPNDGYMTIDKVLNAGSTTDFTEQMSFTIADSRIANWVNAKDIWLWGMLRYDWSDIHMPIASIDESTGTINTKMSCDYGVLAGQKFYVYNIFEELDAPGEWYLDRDTNTFYMYPLDENKDAKVLMAFSSASLLSFRNAENITFRDVSIMGTRAGCVSIGMSTNIDLKYCEIAYASGSGVTVNGDPGGRTFGDSSYEVDVEGCHIYNVGAQGIYFHYVGNRGDLTPGNCRAFNNWFHDFGTITKTYCGAVNTRGVGVDIEFNLIHDGSHLALNPGGNDITIRFNDVSRALKESADMGVIYNGGDTTARGVLIENNIIHDSTTVSTQHDIHAVYIDDAGAGTTVRKNIIYNVGGNGVFINGGRDNTVENNIFANLKGVGSIMKAQFISGTLYANWETGKLGQAVYSSPIDYTSEPYQKYPHLANIKDDDPPFPKYNVMKNNVSYNCEGGQTIEPLNSGYSIKEIASWGEYGDEIVTAKDVGFKDAKNNDFELKKDSEVFEKLPEFESFETERVGLVTSRLRTALSNNAVAMVVGEPRTYVNWQRTMIDEDDFSRVPFIRNALTYVPLRYLFEAFNAAVEWADGKAVVEYNGKTIELTQGSNVAKVNGTDVNMAGEVINENGRIFVPLRSVSELMEKNVLWKDEGLIVVSEKNLENAFSYEEMVYDLVQRLSER